MMTPRQVSQAALFYEFSLEEHVPPDHLLRSIDRFVDLDDMRRHLAPFYSSMGRPSVDPELMIRMLIVGYCFGIRSERRLCEEVQLNLAYRWFCRLDLIDRVPDHHVLQKPARAIPAERSLPAPLRGRGGAVHRRGPRRRHDLRQRRQPDPGGRQQAVFCIEGALGPRPDRHRDRAAGGARVSRRARRRRLRSGERRRTKVRCLCRSGVAVDRRAEGAGLRRPFRQRPDRHRERGGSSTWRRHGRSVRPSLARRAP
jgi:hypothetical protein